MKAYCVITNQCDQKCGFCYYNTKYLEREKIKDPSLNCLLSRIDFSKEAGCDSISFTGGEPFVRSNVLLKLVEYANALNMRVYVPTNGKYLLRTRWSEKEQAILNMISCITISLNIDNDIDDIQLYLKSFSEKISSLKKYYTGRVRINFTLTKNNSKYLNECLTLFKKDGVNIQPVVIQPESDLYCDYSLYCMKEEDKVEICQAIRKWGDESADGANREYAYSLAEGISNYDVNDSGNKKCNMGDHSFTIQASGNILPCFYRTDYIVGNADIDNVEHIIKKLRFFSVEEKQCANLQCIVVRSAN